MPGVNVVGVQFRRAGRIYDFNGKDLLLSEGDEVVVETDRGASLGQVKRVAYVDKEETKGKALKPVIRIANERDLDPGKLSEEKVVKFTSDRVAELKLDMSVIGSEVQLGGNKVIVFFTAPGRVDFRELVKGLASGLKTRVELKQVGARDEAKLVGGLGMCGREYCCSSFLREFVPVSIKMAKNQNLALNPAKVSGGCGRLLCCLTYEDKVYKELRKKLPPRKARVRLATGDEGLIVKSDILSQKVLVELSTGELISKPLSQVEVLSSKNQAQKAPELEEDGDWGADLDLKSLMEEEPSKKKEGEGKKNRRDRPKRDQRGGGSSMAKKDDKSEDGKKKKNPRHRNRNRHRKNDGQKKPSGSKNPSSSKNPPKK